jgi:nitrogen fixation/metabolism regulation signal transduction histidine kinase
MSPRQANRLQLWVWLLGALFLIANLLLLTITAFAPASPAARAPLLLTIFVAAIIFSLLGILLLLRRLLTPYRKIIGVAEQASQTTHTGRTRDEAQFVLETFQSVVAQLQAQQQELQRLTAQASERAASAEKFSERIVASVPSGLIAFDARGRATVVNAPARSLIEASTDALDQHAPDLLRGVPELAEMVLRCLKTGEVYRREEVSAISIDGRIKRIGVTVAPIELAPERAARGALCLLTDITEVTQLREQIALKKSLASLGEMSAGLAHEFKNALATLHGYAQLLQKTGTSESARNNAATALLQEVRNLAEMVTAFLNFSRPQPLEVSNVSLQEIVKDCADELQSLYDERRVALIIEGDFAEVHADAMLLRQAVLNLLRNAAESISADATERRVIVRGSRQTEESGETFAIIEIEDTGSGIDAADKERIFIPFFTTKSKGHGIGLALAHRVITDHGGTLIAANSARTKGVVFAIRLPL